MIWRSRRLRLRCPSRAISRVAAKAALCCKSSTKCRTCQEVLAVPWRGHSCPPRRHSCRRFFCLSAREGSSRVSTGQAKCQAKCLRHEENLPVVLQRLQVRDQIVLFLIAEHVLVGGHALAAIVHARTDGGLGRLLAVGHLVFLEQPFETRPHFLLIGIRVVAHGALLEDSFALGGVALAGRKHHFGSGGQDYAGRDGTKSIRHSVLSSASLRTHHSTTMASAVGLRPRGRTTYASALRLRGASLRARGASLSARSIDTTLLSKIVMSCTMRATSAPSSTVTSCSIQSESGMPRKNIRSCSTRLFLVCVRRRFSRV